MSIVCALASHFSIVATSDIQKSKTTNSFDIFLLNIVVVSQSIIFKEKQFRKKFSGFQFLGHSVTKNKKLV